MRALDNFRPSFYPIKDKTLLLLLPMRVITCRMRNVVSQWQQQPRCLALRVCVLCWYWCLDLCLDYGFCLSVCGCRIGWLIERLTVDRLTDRLQREYSGNFILNVPQHVASICLCFISLKFLHLLGLYNLFFYFVFFYSFNLFLNLFDCG